MKSVASKGIISEDSCYVGYGVALSGYTVSIDGRVAYLPVFNRAADKPATLLQPVEAKPYDSGAVLIRYKAT